MLNETGPLLLNSTLSIENNASLRPPSAQLLTPSEVVQVTEDSSHSCPENTG